MARVHDALVRLGAASVAGDLDATVVDHDVGVADDDLDVPPHERMWNAVAHGVDVDEAVGRDPALQTPLADAQWRCRQRLQRGALGTLEEHAGLLVRRAVDAAVGLAHPLREVRLERGEAVEGAPGDPVALHVADARLGLALGACAIRPTRRHRDAPVLAERRERRMDARGARLAVLADHERAGAVDQDLGRDAAEHPERGGQALAPVVLPLAQRRTHEDPARVAEHRDE